MKKNKMTHTIIPAFSKIIYETKLTYSDNEAVSYINTFGFAQKIGESGVLSLGIMSLDFGKSPI